MRLMLGRLVLLTDAGVEMAVIQRLLGHSDAKVTQGYLPSQTGRLQQVMDALPDAGVADTKGGVNSLCC